MCERLACVWKILNDKEIDDTLFWAEKCRKCCRKKSKDDKKTVSDLGLLSFFSGQNSSQPPIISTSLAAGQWPTTTLFSSTDIRLFVQHKSVRVQRPQPWKRKEKTKLSGHKDKKKKEHALDELRGTWNGLSISFRVSQRTFPQSSSSFSSFDGSTCQVCKPFYGWERTQLIGLNKWFSC